MHNDLSHLAAMTPNSMSPIAPKDLPRYIHFPLMDLAHLSHADRSELDQYGGLTVPPPALRNHILRGFAEYVYPQMPVVNVQDIVAAIDGAGGEPVSLLLFQAIMFAGASYVPLEHLQRYGYSSHSVARRELYQRVESCFNATAHAGLASPVVLIQAALLLTLWYDPMGTSKDGHYWMRAVIALSADIGMHHGASHAKDFQDRATLRLRRRIAWVTYARDRIILLGARCPALIRAADLTLTPLTVDDFELEPVRSNVPSCLPLDCMLFRDSRQLRDMASLCVMQVRLAQCIDAVFTPQVDTASSPTPFAPTLGASDAKLKTWWLQCLEQDPEFDKSPPSSLYPHQRGLVVQRLVLRLTYSTIISALHRPLVLRGTLRPDQALGHGLLESCKVSLEYSTQDITRLADYLFNQNLSLYLPASVVTSLLSALIVHMSLSRATEMDVRSASLTGFQKCLLLLDRLRSRHTNAEDVFNFLDRTVTSASGDSGGDSAHMSELSAIFGKVKREAPFADEEFPMPAMSFYEQGYDQQYTQDLFKWPPDNDFMSSDFHFLDDTGLGFLPDLNFDLNGAPVDLDVIFAD